MHMCERRCPADDLETHGPGAIALLLVTNLVTGVRLHTSTQRRLDEVFAQQKGNTMISRAKAESYDRYRLPYSAEAAAFVLDRIGPEATAAADIGAGTGLLTRHFAGRLPTVYAVEPEAEMRAVLERNLPGVISIDGVAEATTLPDRSVDVIIAANAYHRFDPAGAVAEFRRILRPGAWLALFSYRFQGAADDADLRARFPKWRRRLEQTRHTLPPEHFYGAGVPERHTFAQTHTEAWPAYWGAVLSGMEAPGPEDDWLPAFAAAHRERFAQRAVNGILTVAYSTEVVLGQPHYT